MCLWQYDHHWVLPELVCPCTWNNNNKLYNEYFDKPKKEGGCDECGSIEFVERSDDEEKTIVARLEEYRKNTLPMIEYYKEKGRFFTVHAGESKEKVTQEVASIIKKGWLCQIFLYYAVLIF